MWEQFCEFLTFTAHLGSDEKTSLWNQKCILRHHLGQRLLQGMRYQPISCLAGERFDVLNRFIPRAFKGDWQDFQGWKFQQGLPLVLGFTLASSPGLTQGDTLVLMNKGMNEFESEF